MIKIENTEVYGWEAAIRGMRNPMNSWDKSDSFSLPPNEDGSPWLGKKDIDLMQILAKAGSDHGKFLRMITVTCDITAPLYWWKEFDTYKVGTVANSCSTMHKISEKEFTIEDFSQEHLTSHTKEIMKTVVIEELNRYRKLYLEWEGLGEQLRYSMQLYEKKDAWWQMIQLLPSSFNQKRTVLMNYEVLRNIDRPGRRKDHKLDEWRYFCKWAESLPYFSKIVLQ